MYYYDLDFRLCNYCCCCYYGYCSKRQKSRTHFLFLPIL